MTMVQFDHDNLRIARPSEVLGNIKVLLLLTFIHVVIATAFSGYIRGSVD